MIEWERYNNQKVSVRKLNQGFTIVELLIVVVVIAILATITIIAYNGITTRTRQSMMQSDLQQTSKLIENYKTTNGSYPSVLGALNDGRGVKASNGAQYAYTTSGNDYFLTIGSSPAQSVGPYKISNTTGRIESGTWSGHDAMLSGYPTRGGYTDITNSYGSGNTISVSLVGIPEGAWMIAVFTTFVNSDVGMPPGWTYLLPRKTTNTMQTSILAKIKTAGDADTQEFDAPGASGRTYVNAALLWGQNSAPLNSWVLGAYGDRNSNATASSALTPTITTTSAKNLVLSIATERTTADETLYTSLTGATPWIWIPQPTGNTNKIQTIAIGYNEQATPGVTQPMTVVYPNAQTFNATAVQVAIPPAN